MSHQPAESPDYPLADFSKTEEPRRGFFKQFLAVAFGGVVSLVPLATGLAVFLDPLRSRKKKGGQTQDDEGYIRVASLDGLLADAAPHKFSVIDDRADAWNLFPQESIGLVFLIGDRAVHLERAVVARTLVDRSEEHT